MHDVIGLKKIPRRTADTVDPDVMLHCVAPHLGPHCLSMFPVGGYPYVKRTDVSEMDANRCK